MTNQHSGAEPTVDVFKDAEEIERVAATEALAVLRDASNPDGAPLETRAQQGQDAPSLPALPLKDLVHWVLTGGGVGIGTLRRIAEHPDLESVDWSRVHIWWGDERFLESGDPERNETQAREALVDQLINSGLLPEDNVHAMPALGATVVGGSDHDYEDVLVESIEAQVLDPGDSAAFYDEELAKYAQPEDQVPHFDLLMLGMGPDGHVASLFPGNVALDVTGTATTGVWDSPKPPPERVSLTFESIRSAQRVWLMAAGAEKAPAIATAKAGAPVSEVPAVGAQGTSQTRWFLDTASAYITEEEG